MDDRLANCHARPVTFDSAARAPRPHSPAGWLPRMVDIMAYADESGDARVGVWFLCFAGG